MKSLSAALFSLLIVSESQAGLLTTSLKTESLKVNGVVSHELGDKLVINGRDENKTPYKLTIESKPNQGNTAYFEYWLERNGKKESGRILQLIGEKASLSVSENGQAPKLTFDVLYNQ